MLHLYDGLHEKELPKLWVLESGEEKKKKKENVSSMREKKRRERKRIDFQVAWEFNKQMEWFLDMLDINNFFHWYFKATFDIKKSLETLLPLSFHFSPYVEWEIYFKYSPSLSLSLSHT